MSIVVLLDSFSVFLTHKYTEKGVNSGITVQKVHSCVEAATRTATGLEAESWATVAGVVAPLLNLVVVRRDKTP